MNSKIYFFACLLACSNIASYANPIDSLGLKKDNNKTFIVYKVGSKQTLFSILKRYNLSLSEFKQVNQEIEIPLKPGELVFIPLHYLEESPNNLGTPVKSIVEKTALEKSNSSSEKFTNSIAEKSTEKVTGRPTDPGIHIVSGKQSLLTVANLYKITMADVRKWNNLTSDNLKEGQRLSVDAPQKMEIDKSTLLTGKNDKLNPDLKTPEITKENDSPTLKKTIENGMAELIDVPDNSGKYLALHKSAPIGTLILVKNLANNQSIWVKVIGRLPTNDTKLIIKLSPKAFERLNAVDKRIRAEISYLIQ